MRNNYLSRSSVRLGILWMLLIPLIAQAQRHPSYYQSAKGANGSNLKTALFELSVNTKHEATNSSGKILRRRTFAPMARFGTFIPMPPTTRRAVRHKVLTTRRKVTRITANIPSRRVGLMMATPCTRTSSTSTLLTVM